MRNIFKALIVFIALLTSFCFLSHTEASSNLYSAGYIKNDIPCEKIIANVNTASEIISKDSITLVLFLKKQTLIMNFQLLFQKY